jgi:hypothetical protein
LIQRNSGFSRLIITVTSEDIDYVAIQDNHLQGQVITPTRGVSDCYDMDDFIRAETGSGNQLVMRVMQEWKPANAGKYWLLATASMLLLSLVTRRRPLFQPIHTVTARS